MVRRSLSAMTALLVCSAAVAADPDFTGKWVNVDANTQEVTRLVITTSKDATKVEAWGKCKPKDCEWGAAALSLLGESTAAKKLPYGFASWDHKNGIVTHMTLRYQKDQLIVETFEIFTDNSDRSNVRVEMRFQRAGK